MRRAAIKALVPLQHVGSLVDPIAQAERAGLRRRAVAGRARGGYREIGDAVCTLLRDNAPVSVAVDTGQIENRRYHS